MKPSTTDSALSSLLGMTALELAQAIATLPGGDRPFRARQLFRWLHAHNASSFAEMTNLPADLRAALAARCVVSPLRVAEVQDSQTDACQKLLLKTRDDQPLECVRLETPKRVTLCLSSQVGCGFGCAFCRTASMGFVRNLDAAEIVGQLQALAQATPLPARYNIVFMGMGEPLANYEALVHATDIFSAEGGRAIGPRRITVSTVGLVPEMRRLARERPKLRLAVSLHAATDATRAALVPIAQRYPLGELIDAAEAHARITNHRVTFEYVLLAGVNDSEADARALARWVSRVPCKVNLIPYNPGDGVGPRVQGASGFQAPPPQVVERFARVLEPRTGAVTVRRTLGQDILAACGQLAERPAAVAPPSHRVPATR